MAISLGDAILYFKGDMAGLDKSTASIGQTITKVGLGVTAFGATVTGALGTCVKGFSDYAETIDTAAKKTGMGTDAVQEWKFAAEQSSATIDDVTNAVKFMANNLDTAGTASAKSQADLENLNTEYVRAVEKLDMMTASGKASSEQIFDQQNKISDLANEIQQGAAGSSGAFQRLGLNVESLKAMKPEEAFETIMAALAGVPDAMEQTAIAQDIFGRGALALKPLMAEGAAGIAGLRQEARDLGLVMDQEAIVAGEKFGDEMTKLKNSMMPVVAELAEALIPMITDLAKWLRDGIMWVVQFAKEHTTLFDIIVKGTAIVGGLAVVLGPLLLIVQPLIALFGGLSTVIGGIGAAAGVATTAVGGLGLAGAALAAAPWIIGIAAIAAALTGVVYIAGKVAESFNQLSESSARLDGQEQQYVESLRAKGVVLDENAMKEMDYSQRLAYMAEQEQASLDETLRTQIYVNTGKAASDQQYAQARNLSLNEWLSAEEAAAVASMGLSEDKLMALLQADEAQTASILGELGIRAAAEQSAGVEKQSLFEWLATAEMEADTSVTDMMVVGAQTMLAAFQEAAIGRQAAYTDSANAIVTAEGTATSMIGGFWQNLWDTVKGWFGGGSMEEPAAFARGGTVGGKGEKVVIEAGEEGPEEAETPEGDMAILGMGGPGLFAVPPGTEIKTAEETEAEYVGAFASGGLVLSRKQKKQLKKSRKEFQTMLNKAMVGGLLSVDETAQAKMDVFWGTFPMTGLFQRDDKVTGEKGEGMYRGGDLEWEIIKSQKGGILKSDAGELNLKNVPRFAGGGTVTAAAGTIQNNTFKIEIRDVTIREEADIDRISQKIAQTITLAFAGTA